jgi:hypothetical protein
MRGTHQKRDREGTTHAKTTPFSFLHHKQNHLRRNPTVAGRTVVVDDFACAFCVVVVVGGDAWPAGGATHTS